MNTPTGTPWTVSKNPIRSSASSFYQVWSDEKRLPVLVATVDNEADAHVIAASPRMFSALLALCEHITSGDHYESTNPYRRPCVVEALKVLDEAMGGHWDADTGFLSASNRAAEFLDEWRKQSSIDAPQLAREAGL